MVDFGRCHLELRMGNTLRRIAKKNEISDIIVVVVIVFMSLRFRVRQSENANAATFRK
jgi:hypothetical protein